MKANTPTTGDRKIRCAVYTRKSTEEGLEQEFNSLDAQRESGEAYVASQKGEGMVLVPDRYDDGGFTGANMDRPALKRLLADIKAGKIDCVITYKVDRLTRSLLDFARMMETFEQHNIAFVSVTQQINSANSMGRLMLNVLLSFAQFEREIIGERTRDKKAAARRKGKSSGGMPLLGYDVEAGSKLHINDAEAQRVRLIFALYLELHSLGKVVRELNQRGWCTKQWTTQRGPVRGGQPFTKTALYRLLTNVTYVGKVRYKAEIHPGEHLAIVDELLWNRVQALLERNAAAFPERRSKSGAILQGLLRCGPCNCVMSPTHSTKRGRRWSYYVCANAQRNGWARCPSKSVSAGQIEAFVFERLIEQLRADTDVGGLGLEPDQWLECLDRFQTEWPNLSREAQGDVLHQIIQVVVYDSTAQTVSITVKPEGTHAILNHAQQLEGSNA